jgi:activator of HSP90 ATPase
MKLKRTEKNAAPWSRNKLKELLVGLVLENDKFSVKFKTITKCEGEASANNRKSKLIFFYEWVIAGEWEGRGHFWGWLAWEHIPGCYN